jgi:hypothetical protein
VVILDVSSFEGKIASSNEVVNVNHLETDVETRQVFFERLQKQLKQKRGQGFDILSYVKKNPQGVTREQICKGIGVSIGSGAVAAFLVVLRDAGYIRTVKRGSKTVYFSP